MYFKTKREVVDHLHRVWKNIGPDDMYGRAAINDAITCVCYGNDDLKDDVGMDMENYTLELTFDELKIVALALAYEVDRLDVNDSPRLGDTEAIKDRVHDMYINAKRAYEHERSWINAERNRV